MPEEPEKSATVYEQLERVARAICYANTYRAHVRMASPEHCAKTAAYQSEHAWDLWLDEARAALAALQPKQMEQSAIEGEAS